MIILAGTWQVNLVMCSFYCANSENSLLHTQEVVGSSPTATTINKGLSLNRLSPFPLRPPVNPQNQLVFGRRLAGTALSARAVPRA